MTRIPLEVDGRPCVLRRMSADESLVAELRDQLESYIEWDAKLREEARRKDPLGECGDLYPWGPQATVLKADDWLRAKGVRP